MRLVRIEDPQYFDSILNHNLEEKSHVFILFYGRDLPETGESYCPDCRKGLPIIMKALNTLPDEDYTLITAIVDRRQITDSPTWVYRTREDIKLTAVPTLALWKKGEGITAKLIEDECFVYEDVLKLAHQH